MRAFSTCRSLIMRERNSSMLPTLSERSSYLSTAMWRHLTSNLILSTPKRNDLLTPFSVEGMGVLVWWPTTVPDTGGCLSNVFSFMTVRTKSLHACTSDSVIATWLVSVLCSGWLRALIGFLFSGSVFILFFLQRSAARFGRSPFTKQGRESGRPAGVGFRGHRARPPDGSRPVEGDRSNRGVDAEKTTMRTVRKNERVAQPGPSLGTISAQRTRRYTSLLIRSPRKICFGLVPWPSEIGNATR